MRTVEAVEVVGVVTSLTAVGLVWLRRRWWRLVNSVLVWWRLVNSVLVWWRPVNSVLVWWRLVNSGLVWWRLVN
jgi:hypothetical protein